MEYNADGDLTGASVTSYNAKENPILSEAFTVCEGKWSLSSLSNYYKWGFGVPVGYLAHG
jgi:hypothetical protein